MLIPKSAGLVEQGGKGLRPGKVNTVVHKEDGYVLSIFKSPKVGKKAACAVPLVTNCHHGPHVWRKRRYRLAGIVANYRTFAPGVDVCNLLCLQHPEERRFPNWWKALNGMLPRLASTNAFTSCKALKLCAPIGSGVSCGTSFQPKKLRCRQSTSLSVPRDVHACAVGAADRCTNDKLVAFRCMLIALRSTISRAEGRSYGMGGRAPLRSSRRIIELTTPNAATPRRFWLGMEGIGMWHKQKHTCKHTNTRTPHTHTHTQTHIHYEVK